jgi:hypothetical protein
MRRLIALFALAASASVLGGCTASGTQGFVPSAAASHAVHIQDNNGGILPGGGGGDPGGQ